MIRAAVSLLAAAAITHMPPTRTASGASLGVLSIPRIGVVTPIDQGGSDLFTVPWPVTLDKGPAHYPLTGYPWTRGLIALSGHRTTFTHPFGKINLLRKGDPIIWKAHGVRYLYRVTGMKIVLPTDFAKLGLRAVRVKLGGKVTWTLVPISQRGHRLVLVACHPPHLASERIAVFATLVSQSTG